MVKQTLSGLILEKDNIMIKFNDLAEHRRLDGIEPLLVKDGVSIGAGDTCRLTALQYARLRNQFIHSSCIRIR